jgi:O-antigen ligase
MLAQLVPLQPETIRQISPGTNELLLTTNIQYALDAQADDTTNRYPLSVNPSKTRIAVAVFCLFTIFCLGLLRILDSNQVAILALGLSCTGILLSAIGVMQAAMWNGRIYGFWSPFNDSGIAAFGPFINRNHFAGWVLMVLPLTLAYVIAVAQSSTNGLNRWRDRILWTTSPTGGRAIVMSLAALAMTSAVVVTGSRSGVIGLAAMVVMFSIVLLFQQRDRSRRRVTFVTYLLVLLAVAFAWGGIELVANRFASAGSSLDGRVYVWRDAWEVHKMFPWFGTGMNTYGTAMTVHQRFMPADVLYAQAHNDYLQLLAEGGWMVTVPAIVIAAVAAIQARRRFQERRDSDLGYWFRVGAVIGIFSIAIQECAEFSLQLPANTALFCVISAIALRPPGVAARPTDT